MAVMAAAAVPEAGAEVPTDWEQAEAAAQAGSVVVPESVLPAAMAALEVH